jgi:GDPmannose 4,6-dehydratase
VQFVTRKITRTVAAISLGLEQRLVLGDLEARRDWGWAPDYARALAAMAPLAGDYVVATGRSRSVRDFVAAAFAAAGIDDWEALVESDDRFRRPQDPQELVGDSTKLREATGWRPTRTFEEMVAAMVAADIAELGAGASS